jgi:hypothetical protein
MRGMATLILSGVSWTIVSPPLCYKFCAKKAVLAAP